ncbi:unnamed protein product [Hyaloperonospora brassicae]|uniref:Uncharacterized protein n=1 Tax=Hyaloperonospora brassicae TaxID=162125 RepID=A0AAV0V3H1_HYABA|nr:unnamed protein product [Hyaloperonospora brassicae]
MLLMLVDECKQRVWAFLDAQGLCRVACVARDAQQGVRVGPVWLRHSRALLTEGLASLQTELGVPGYGPERGCGRHRHLMLRESQYGAVLEDRSRDAIVDWRRWYRDTHVALRTSRSSSAEFVRAMSDLQQLKTQRLQLKEAIQRVKASAHADKQSRRGQMNCVRWMNRTHRRLATNANLMQAQHAAMSKAELAEKLQCAEKSIQDTTREQFGLRKQAMKSLHKLKTQLASGIKMMQDLDTHVELRS